MLFRSVRSLIAVHPHACGEHVLFYLILAFNCGSSPRVWGTPANPGRRFFARRFIPTRVGNTLTGAEQGSTPTVHPHACGEHPGRAIYKWAHIGSSPRVWGTPVIKTDEEAYKRFIPTRVGNTSSSHSDTFLKSVHPHACGEHIQS